MLGAAGAVLAHISPGVVFCFIHERLGSTFLLHVDLCHMFLQYIL